MTIPGFCRTGALQEAMQQQHSTLVKRAERLVLANGKSLTVQTFTRDCNGEEKVAFQTLIEKVWDESMGKSVLHERVRSAPLMFSEFVDVSFQDFSSCDRNEFQAQLKGRDDSIKVFIPEELRGRIVTRTEGRIFIRKDQFRYTLKEDVCKGELVWFKEEEPETLLDERDSFPVQDGEARIIGCRRGLSSALRATLQKAEASGAEQVGCAATIQTTGGELPGRKRPMILLETSDSVPANPLESFASQNNSASSIVETRRGLSSVVQEAETSGAEQVGCAATIQTTGGELPGRKRPMILLETSDSVPAQPLLIQEEVQQNKTKEVVRGNLRIRVGEEEFRVKLPKEEEEMTLFYDQAGCVYVHSQEDRVTYKLWVEGQDGEIKKIMWTPYQEISV